MIGQAFTTAFRSIWSKKIRSLLTTLGVIIGVAQIISLIGLGQGIKQSVSSEVTSLGTNILFVLPGKLQNSQGGFNPGASVGASTLTDGDVTAIRNLPDIKSVTPLGLMAATPAVGTRTADGTFVMASEASFLNFLTMYKISAGRFFTEAENTSKQPVIVMSKEAAIRLFPGSSEKNVIGKTVTLGKTDFTLIGTITMSQSNLLFSESGNTGGGLALVPYNTAKNINPNTQIFRIGVRADDQADVNQVKKEMAALLKDRHGAVDTTVFTQDDLLSVVDNILGLITTSIVALASISLIVGGIGIMNIMLVAVSERTKEIGLRKALGATRGHILWQFLTESAVISLIGGAIGVAIAAIAGIFSKAKADLPIVINLHSVLIAVGFSLGVGIIFGLLPAIRAASKDPIEALRYE